MTMGSDEGFKEYAQKLKDLDGRVQPPLTDRESVDMFMGTLTGPCFNLLIRRSSSEFTEMILTGEQVKSGIKSGKIPMVSTSTTKKKPFVGKKETNAAYGLSSRIKNDHH